VLKSALEEVTNAEPFLPFPGSVLPALVALRKTHQTIVESKAYLAAQGSETDRVRKQLETDRAGEGMGASLAVAAQYLQGLPGTPAAVLVALADMPWIRRASLESVLDALRDGRCFVHYDSYTEDDDEAVPARLIRAAR